MRINELKDKKILRCLGSVAVSNLKTGILQVANVFSVFRHQVVLPVSVEVPTETSQLEGLFYADRADVDGGVPVSSQFDLQAKVCYQLSRGGSVQ